MDNLRFTEKQLLNNWDQFYEKMLDDQEERLKKKREYYEKNKPRILALKKALRKKYRKPDPRTWCFQCGRLIYVHAWDDHIVCNKHLKRLDEKVWIPKPPHIT